MATRACSTMQTGAIWRPGKPGKEFPEQRRSMPLDRQRREAIRNNHRYVVA